LKVGTERVLVGSALVLLGRQLGAELVQLALQRERAQVKR
jgi:hypothetical protein